MQFLTNENESKCNSEARQGEGSHPTHRDETAIVGHLAKADPYGMTTKRQATATATANGSGSDKGSGSWWLFAAVGGFEVAAGGVGLGLVAASG